MSQTEAESPPPEEQAASFLESMSTSADSANSTSEEMGWKKVTWNFLEAGHGKGPADVVGAAVKRRADDIIAQGKDITNDRVLFHSKSLPYEPEDIEAMYMHVPSELQTIRLMMNEDSLDYLR
ncbi:uncharacterized protein LOC114571525 [Scomber scombrus]|uniref:Uncharacterized protein LOC114571525 n=1 Tax=Scomber scombrus TaxID=13677 RepID=A0AAV1Q5K5_SCOSC